MKYTKENPLRVMTLASGYDSQCLALDRLKENFPDFDYELVAWAEFDPESTLPIERQPAVVAHNAFYPQWADRNYGDLTKIDWENVPDFDLLTASTPCLTSDSLILTNKGYKILSEIKEGDIVLTKSNTFHPVLKKFDNGVHPTCFIHGTGFDAIHCTLNHKFLTRLKYRKGHEGIRSFKDPEFTEARSLTRNHYLGFPVNEESIPFITEDVDFWYMVGMYIGDGWLSNRNNDIIIACNEEKERKLKDHLDCEKWKYSVHKNRTCNRFRFGNKEIQNIIRSKFGTGCDKKRIPYDVVRMPIKPLQAFLEGYIDSDGCRPFENYIQFSTINKHIAYTIQLVIAKLYHRVTSITKVKVNPTKVIDGSDVNQRPWYLLMAKLTNDKQDKSFYENGYIWYPFHKIEMAEEENVYNLEIDQDHSYIVNGCISKNCQSISAAGLQHGFDKGSGTRSSIIWDVHDCVRIKRPKYIIMENVSAILSGKFLELLLLWCSEVEKMGYVNFMPPAFDTPWNGGRTKDGCLNSKNYGIPQNRERWFMVSILRTKDEPEPRYFFPKPFKLETCLADVLQEDVDESFFLRDEMLARFCEKSIENEKTDDGMELGIEGCSSDNLETCKYCKYECATEQCGRLYRLMEKFGKTPLGAKYPDF